MSLIKKIGVAALTLALVLPVGGKAQEEKKDKSQAPQARPAIVVLQEIRQGQVQPMTAFVGTIFYSRVSDVAAEVDGQVRRIDVSKGQRVEKGQPLAALNTDLLDLGIAQKLALAEEAEVELRQAGKDMDRLEKLYREKSVAYTIYDDARFKVLRLEKKVWALKSTLSRDRLMKKKMTVLSPFSGVVLKKSTEAGEWVGPGSPVATVAEDGEVDAVIEVPEKILSYLEKGGEVPVAAGGASLTGRYEAVIPRGDVASRTFSVKIRLANEAGLMEGMEARATLPTGSRIDGLLVSRDALVNQFGRDVIFVSVEGTAKMVPVQVLGYQGLMVGISGPGLSAGMKAVVKGNERLRDGQPLRVEQQKPESRSQKPE